MNSNSTLACTIRNFKQSDHATARHLLVANDTLVASVAALQYSTFISDQFDYYVASVLSLLLPAAVASAMCSCPSQ